MPSAASDADRATGRRKPGGGVLEAGVGKAAREDAGGVVVVRPTAAEEAERTTAAGRRRSYFLFRYFLGRVLYSR